MATRTLTAMYDTYPAAAEAVRALELAGVSHDAISIVSNDPANSDHVTGAGTGTGASLGTLLGGGAGLLAGLGLLAIPGLGPVVAAGWLVSTVVGAGVGAVAGGIVGALTDAGVSHEDAHAYAEGVNRGGTLVTVRTDETQARQAADILDREGSIDIDARQAEWRTAGWSGPEVATDTFTGASSIAPPRPLTGTVVSEPRRVRIYGDGI